MNRRTRAGTLSYARAGRFPVKCVATDKSVTMKLHYSTLGLVTDTLTTTGKFLLSLLTCAALINSAWADPVTFTFTATANATGQGYTLGASYNFSFTTGASYATLSTLSQSTFTAGSNNYWKNFSTADSALFVSASGNGLGGTFVPSATNPSSYIFQNGLGGSDFIIGTTNTSQTVGMTTLSGTPLSYFNAGGLSLSLSPGGAYTGSFVDPTTYFAARPGVYAVTSPNPLQLYGLGGGGSLLAGFTVNQLTISAIPEPSTSAAIAGAAMLGLAVWRRRRQSKPGAITAA